MYSCVLFFKQKTAYELRISDWSSDVCSSDLRPRRLSRAELCLSRELLPQLRDMGEPPRSCCPLPEFHGRNLFAGRALHGDLRMFRQLFGVRTLSGRQRPGPRTRGAAAALRILQICAAPRDILLSRRVAARGDRREEETGRASCRESVCKSVLISV